MILSLKFMATLFVLFTSTILINSVNANQDFNDDNEDTIDSSVEDTAADSVLLTREAASAFNNDEEDKQEGGLLRTLVRRKLDAEEIKEIKSKSEARRRKAYENYEESCKPKGKFTARSCPILADCYTKNKLPYVPVATKPQMTTAVALTSTALVPRPAFKPKAGRQFILREWASQFLETNDEDNNDDDEDETYEPASEPMAKRLFKSKTSELAEETNERRNKAFKKYEEYCEKRIFRIGSERNCPALNKKLC